MQIVIIGAGIMGAALAYALSRQGATCTVVDAAGVASGATGATFGWVNASFHEDAAHFALRAEGIQAYRRLCRNLDLPVNWSGCLCWEETGDALDAQAQTLGALGYATRVVSRADIALMEPQLHGVTRAVFFADEAAVEGAALTRALLSASGAKLLTGCRVEGIDLAGGAVSGVRIPGGVLPADKVIVAGGMGCAALLAPFGVALPMLQRPGVILRSEPVAPVLKYICVAPIGEFRQLPDGRILMPTAVSHQGDATEVVTERLDVLAEAATARLQKVLPRVPLTWQDVALAERPVPQDGLPVVGACGPKGLYTAVMHSGITLAPVVAEILAAEIVGSLSNGQANLVAPYRPDRFQSAIS